MKKKRTPLPLLLLEDVKNLGKKGELVFPNPGWTRNFLLPKKKGVLASQRTIGLQAQLKKERSEQAGRDQKEGEVLATRLRGKTLTTTVKTDPHGHLYGSVTALDIAELLSAEEGMFFERGNVLLPKPLKKAGTYEIKLRFKEEVCGSVTLKVMGDQVIEKSPSDETGDEAGNEAGVETEQTTTEEVSGEKSEATPEEHTGET